MKFLAFTAAQVNQGPQRFDRLATRLLCFLLVQPVVDIGSDQNWLKSSEKSALLD